MSYSKYILRSPEVQEVMRKPPHYLITWSNTIILAMILVGIWLLNSIQLPNKITIPFHVSISNDTIYLISNRTPTKKIKPNQAICLSFESYPPSIYGSIFTQIDAINSSNNQDIIRIHNLNKTMCSNTNKHITINNNQLGIAEITIGERTMVDMFKAKQPWVEDSSGY